MGRRGSGQEGISPGSLSLGGTFNRSLLEISPAPSQALGQASVCCGDLGSQGQAFIAGTLLLALGGVLCRLPGADGPAVGKALGPKRIGGLSSHPLCGFLGPPAPRP